MKVAYWGNFRPTYSTESHVALSIESLGHKVTRLQEGVLKPIDVASHARNSDLLLWTQTQTLAEVGSSRAERFEMLDTLRTPTAGLHLDRWWGLARERLIHEEPFFKVDRLFTADGGHDDQWHQAGINHTWMPPAVYHGEAIDVPAARVPEIIFVGSWRRYGHNEWWPQRKELLDKLRIRYRRRFACYPRTHPVRGLGLNALYRGAKIVIGDSCLANSSGRFWSDRIPETLGRGGFLLHPYVPGLDTQYIDGEHLRLWEHGNFKELFRLIDFYLAKPTTRQQIRAAGARHVRAHHTYQDRLRVILKEMS
jgi:hypothetical protein